MQGNDSALHAVRHTTSARQPRIRTPVRSCITQVGVLSSGLRLCRSPPVNSLSTVDSRTKASGCIFYRRGRLARTYSASRLTLAHPYRLPTSVTHGSTRRYCSLFILQYSRYVGSALSHWVLASTAGYSGLRSNTHLYSDQVSSAYPLRDYHNMVPS